jgi:hypothetical protein
MTTNTPTNIAMATFSRSELQILHALRERYGQDRDIFTPPELARLRFMRWLARTGQLTP